MRRHLLAGFLLLDGLFALAAPALLPALMLAPPVDAQPVYAEIAGSCVETVEAEGMDLAGFTVSMAFCER